MMLVLFDQGTPVPIRLFLKEHTVQTTAGRGWDTIENGELLKAEITIRQRQADVSSELNFVPAN